MIRIVPFVLLAAVAAAAPAAAQPTQVEVEPFGPQGFTNAFFEHQLEYPLPNWDVINVNGDWVLHLVPNTDVITWTLPAGKIAQSVSVEITDFETEPFGPGGTSSVIARSSAGDFARFNTVQIGVPELAFIDVDTPGVLTGQPLGDIVSLQLQASNTGGGLGVGAFFDDLTVSLVDSAFDPVGPGLAGAQGVPTLVGEGTLQPGSLVKVTYADALASAPAFLVVGFSELSAPFMGGVLVPEPDIVLDFVTSGEGGATFSGLTPGGAPSGLSFWVQVWIVDPAGAFGFAATNGIVGTTP